MRFKRLFWGSDVISRGGEGGKPRNNSLNSVIKANFTYKEEQLSR